MKSGDNVHTHNHVHSQNRDSSGIWVGSEIFSRTSEIFSGDTLRASLLPHIALLSIILITYTSITILFPVIPLYASFLGASKSEVGLIVGIFSYVAALLLIPFGALSDRFSRPAILMLGIALLSSAYLLYLAIASTRDLFVVRIVHGAVIALLLPTITALIIDLSPHERRGAYVGVMSMAMQVGFVFGPLIGGILLSVYGYHGTFIACAMLAIVCVAPCGILVMRRNFVSKMSAYSPEESSFWNRKVLAALLIPALATLTSGTIVFSVPLFVKEMGMGSVEAGVAISSMYVTSAAMRIPAGVLSDIKGRVKVILAGIFIEGVATTMYYLTSDWVGVLLVSATVGIGMGMVMPASIAMLGDFLPHERRGMGMGMMSASMQLGIALGASTMGVVAEYLGFRLMYVICGTVQLVLASAVALAFFLLRS